MKTKRRHELQTNVLADWLGKQYELLKPYWPFIALGVAALVLLYAGVQYALTYMGNSPPPNQESWTAYVGETTDISSDSATRADGLVDIADKYDGSPASLWARQQAAELQLQDGMREVYRERDEARDLLTKARDNYDAVIKDAKGEDLAMLWQRALLGKAKACESLAAVREDDASLAELQRKDLEAARDAYQLLAKSAGDGLLGQRAKDALALLADEDGAIRAGMTDLYAELARRGPASFEPPLGLNDLSDAPDLSFPEAALQAIESEDADGEPSGDPAPADGAAPSSDPAPADDATPSSDAAPADDAAPSGDGEPSTDDAPNDE